MTNLSSYSYKILARMVGKCKGLVDSDLPLMIALMKMTVNGRVQTLSDSSEDSTYVDSETKKELIEGGYVIQRQNTTQLILTAKGIWEVMFREDGYTTEQLIDGLQDMFFNEFSETKITASNRIALFSIISMRCFSKRCCVDVKIQAVSKKWWDVFLSVNDFFLEKGVIQEKASIRNAKKVKNDSEDAAVNLIRHSDRVPRYTHGMFSKSNKLEYWVDVLDESGNIDTDRLARLIKMTLTDSIDETNYVEYATFANDLCLDMGYTFESSFEDTQFLSSSHDDTIALAFEKASTLDM